MPGQLRMIDCELCAPVVAAPASSLRLIANRIVMSREEMLLVADHAPMTLGHLLLIPRDHHTGMASFMAARPGAAAAIRELTRMYCHGFGACTVIEHGSGGKTSRTGPCIDHAHWHLFPFTNELRPIVDGDYGTALKRLDSLTQLSRTYAEQDYLLYWDHDGARAALLDVPARLPQYARSVVARHTDASARPYDWDWALRTDDELLSRTLAVSRRLLTGGDGAAQFIEKESTTGEMT